MELVNLIASEMVENHPEIVGLVEQIKSSSNELDSIIRDVSKKSESITPLDENENSITNS